MLNQLLLEKIPILIATVLISFLVGFTIGLNRYAIDKSNNKVKIPLLYISEIMISTVVGTMAGILCMSYSEKIELWFVITCLSSYMGKKSINVISRIVLTTLKIPTSVLEDKSDNEKENCGE